MRAKQKVIDKADCSTVRSKGQVEQVEQRIGSYNELDRVVMARRTVACGNAGWHRDSGWWRGDGGGLVESTGSKACPRVG